MSDPRDYKVEISGLSPEPASSGGPVETRPFVSVQFACCKVYLRIYRSRDGKSYEGRCPKCGVPVKFVVGQGGTESRSFVVR